MRGGRRVAPLPSPRRGRRWIRAFRERPETDEGALPLPMTDERPCHTQRPMGAARRAGFRYRHRSQQRAPSLLPAVGEGGSGRSVNAWRRMRGPLQFPITNEGAGTRRGLQCARCGERRAGADFAAETQHVRRPQGPLIRRPGPPHPSAALTPSPTRGRREACAAAGGCHPSFSPPWEKVDPGVP